MLSPADVSLLKSEGLKFLLIHRQSLQVVNLFPE